MTDIALFRAIERVPAKVTAVFSSDVTNLPCVQVTTEQPVDTVFGALIDGRTCASVEQLSETQFILEVPRESWVFAPDSFEVSIEGIGAGASSGVIPASMGLGKKVHTLQGTAKAIQAAYRELLITPGSDPRNRSRGGGLLQLVRGLHLETSDITAQVRDCVERANRSLSTSQNIKPGQPFVSRIDLVSVTVGSPTARPAALGAQDVVLNLRFRFQVQQSANRALSTIVSELKV